jgi:hypothetical protein
LRSLVTATMLAMADWRQIQARIRKAKASTDAAAKLAELYEQTRDAMVAFELARWQEKAGEHAEAARWYTAAAERFRRSQWKTKAEAALARLRSPSPAGVETSQGTEASPHSTGEDSSSADASSSASDLSETQLASETGPDMGQDIMGQDVAPDVARPQLEVVREPIQRARSAAAATPGNTAADETGAAPGQRKPRRRGRRGGRNRRRPAKGIASGASPVPAPIRAEVVETPSERPSRLPPLSEEPVPELRPPASSSVSPSASSSASPGVASTAAWQARSRAGEPALASRMAHLESQLRRLLACPHSKLEQAESAPAGPGVLLLSDSDQVSHYYVESCQTLRIAIGNLVRGSRGAKDPPRLKESLAENLGIAESRVTSYLKEHCIVRWLQLDEGAAELSHFAIAVLRPVVNE